MNREGIRVLHTVKSLFAAWLVVLACAAVSQAAIIQYAPPAIAGNTVTFPSVTESSGTNPVPLYGAPSAVGNSLAFRNMDFHANANNAAPALALTDGQLNFTVAANTGACLKTISVQEAGDYTLFNSGAGTSSAIVNSPGLIITVEAVNFQDLLDPAGGFVSHFTFSPTGGSFSQSVPGLQSNTFTGAATFDVEALTGYQHITKVSVSLDNQLIASAPAGTLATISKKQMDVAVSTYSYQVPEPGAALLLALGGLGLMLRRRG